MWASANTRVHNLAQVHCEIDGHFDLYMVTGGSARKFSRKTICAGRGFNAMKTYRNDGSGAPIVSACGQVQTNEAGEYWVGATRATNNTAEMQAMFEAPSWLNSGIECKIFSSSTKVMITVDSLFVKGLIDEMFVARGENKAMAMLLCHLWKVVTEKVRLTIRWVRGHSGDVENTITDELADMGMRLEEMHRWWKRVQPM